VSRATDLFFFFFFFFLPLYEAIYIWYKIRNRKSCRPDDGRSIAVTSNRCLANGRRRVTGGGVLDDSCTATPGLERPLGPNLSIP
jgi:hypothetical protein